MATDAYDYLQSPRPQRHGNLFPAHFMTY